MTGRTRSCAWAGTAATLVKASPQSRLDHQAHRTPMGARSGVWESNHLMGRNSSPVIRQQQATRALIEQHYRGLDG
jgi:hypothetical protein